MTIFIFFAHCISDYGSEYERLCIEKIKSDYPDSIIINPADIIKGLSEEDKNNLKKNLKKNSANFWVIEQKYFYPEIDRSNIMIVARCWNDRSWRGRYTPGVIAEIKYAKKMGKKILEFGE